MSPAERPSGYVRAAAPEQDVRRERGMRIRSRLTIATALPVLLAITLAGSVVVREFGEIYHDEARSRAAEQLRSLALPCARSLAVHALDRLDGYLNQAATTGNSSMPLRFIAMVDPNGAIVANAASGGAEQDGAHSGLDRTFLEDAARGGLPRWRRQRLEDGRLVLDMTMPSISGLRWGTLVARFELNEVERRVADARNIMIGLAMLLTAVLALAQNLALARVVAEPVAELARTAEGIRRGELDSRAWVTSSDELGELAGDFNAMADELQSYTESLERKVEERAAEVRRKNRQLEDVNARLAGAVRELERLATTDKLTGVANRRHFDRSLAFEFRRAERTTHPFCLVMVDVDHFKNYNDRNGHQAGDRALQKLVATLRGKLRTTDLLARYGGEEFVVLLYDTSKKAAMKVAETLRRAVAAADFEHGDGQPLGSVTASFGGARPPPPPPPPPPQRGGGPGCGGVGGAGPPRPPPRLPKPCWAARTWRSMPPRPRGAIAQWPGRPR